jgi:hypothetical protein
MKDWSIYNHIVDGTLDTGGPFTGEWPFLHVYFTDGDITKDYPFAIMPQLAEVMCREAGIEWENKTGISNIELQA